MASYSAPFGAPIQTAVIVSDMDFMDKPQVAKKLFGRYPTQYELGWMKQFGMFNKVKGDLYTWGEKNLYKDAPVISAIATSGNDVLITLASVSHQAAGTRSYPRVGDTIRVGSNEALVKVKNTATASAHIITVKPSKGTSANFILGISAGQQFIVTGSAFSEVTTGYGDSIIPSISTFNNRTQTFNELYQMSFSDASNEKWTDFTNPETGESAPYLTILGAYETERRFMTGIELALFSGQADDGAMLDQNGQVVRKTEGLVETLDSRGTQLGYSGTITTDFWREAIDKARKNYAGTEYLGLMGQNFNFQFQNFMADLGKGTVLINSDRSSNDAIEFNFSKFTYGDFTFKVKTAGILNDPITLGVAGLDYKDRCIFMPTEDIKNETTGTLSKHFSVNYKDQDTFAGNKVSKGWYAKGSTGFYATDGPTNTQNTKAISYYATVGAQTMGATHFLNVRKTS